jgi:hypothetical protein
VTQGTRPTRLAFTQYVRAKSIDSVSSFDGGVADWGRRRLSPQRPALLKHLNRLATACEGLFLSQTCARCEPTTTALSRRLPTIGARSAGSGSIASKALTAITRRRWRSPRSSFDGDQTRRSRKSAIPLHQMRGRKVVPWFPARTIISTRPGRSSGFQRAAARSARAYFRPRCELFRGGRVNRGRLSRRLIKSHLDSG